MVDVQQAQLWRRARGVSALAAALLLVLGAVVLTGWHVGSPGLTRILSDLPAMMPVTAATFILAGGALGFLLDGGPRRLVGALLAGLVLASGALSLASYGWASAGQLLPFAGRMAPFTAMGFTLLGLALLCAARRGGRGPTLAQGLALAASLLPLVTLAGYAFRERRLYAFGHDVGMALHTGVGLLLLCVGLLALRPEHGLMRVVMDASAGGVMARHLLPTVLLPPLLGALVAGGVRASLLDAGFAWPLFTTTTMVAFATLIWRNAAHLNRLHSAQRLAAQRALADAERQATLAAENERLYLAAEQAARQREDVLAIVSHDLKNPLSTVRLSAAVLGRKLAALPEARGLLRQVDTIDRAVLRMQGLITGLLDAARLDAGQALVMERRPEPLAPLVTEALALIEPLAADKALRLERHVEADLEVPCDRERILQVLNNLLGNAVKFTPEGGTIRVEVTRWGGQARVAVRDTGPGIPEAAQAHLFERHWQVESQDARQGSGLGLYIAQGIIAAHGGRIEVESTVGQGSMFSFTLPLSLAEQPTSDA